MTQFLVWSYNNEKKSFEASEHEKATPTLPYNSCALERDKVGRRFRHFECSSLRDCLFAHDSPKNRANINQVRWSGASVTCFHGEKTPSELRFCLLFTLRRGRQRRRNCNARWPRIGRANSHTFSVFNYDLCCMSSAHVACVENENISTAKTSGQTRFIKNLRSAGIFEQQYGALMTPKCLHHPRAHPSRDVRRRSF